MRAGVIQGHFPHGFSQIAAVRQKLARTNPLAAPVAQPHGAANAMQIPDTIANFATVGGEPLPPSIRQKMESFYGTSFGDVRIHVGPHASAIGALAFTQGSHIHFAPGQYNPSTPQGQSILGHELAHVVQQREGRVKNPFGSGVAVVQDHSLEAEADRLGARAAAHNAGASQPKMAIAGHRHNTAQPKMAGPHRHNAACGPQHRCGR